MDMPRLGFGTYGRTGPGGIEAMLTALEVGFRHLDTAQTYDTEREVGEAVRRSGLPRDAVFVTTKVAEENLGPGRVIPSLERSLEALGLERVDLALVHWPARKGGPALEVYLDQMAEARDRGLATQIGVSNFTIALLDATLAHLGEGSILTNQVELNPWFRNRRLADHCAARGVDIAQLALQFSLAHEDMATCVVGSANPENVRKWVEWSQSPPDPELLDEVLAILRPIHDWFYVEGRPENNDPKPPS